MTQNDVPQEGQIVLDPSDVEDVKCKKCGGEFFQICAKFKRLSPLNPKSGGQERFIPVQTIICMSCQTELDSVSLQ